MLFRKLGKRILDFTSALLAVALLSPVLLIVAFMVRWRLGSPVLFRQVRPGYFARPFTILKFRTMTNEKNDAGVMLPDSERLTRFGRFLRSTSLDELPELLNVLKGDMSLVGPRPLRMQYLDLYTPEQSRRHEVLPGITGWAQVNGRNAINWDDQLALDTWYVDNQSFLLDLRILLQTIGQVLKREGINQAGRTTRDDFTGSEV